MPKFLYTVIFLNIISWGTWAYRLINTKPDSTFNILIFLATFFTSLSLTLSLPIYLYFHKKAPNFTNVRFLYRKSLKWSLFFSSGILLLLTLKAFGVMNTLNAGLLIIIYITVFMHFKKKNR